MIDKDYHANIRSIQKSLTEMDSRLHNIDAICESDPQKKRRVDVFSRIVDDMMDNLDAYLQNVDNCLQRIERCLYL